MSGNTMISKPILRTALVFIEMMKALNQTCEELTLVWENTTPEVALLCLGEFWASDCDDPPSLDQFPIEWQGKSCHNYEDLRQHIRTYIK